MTIPSNLADVNNSCQITDNCSLAGLVPKAVIPDADFSATDVQESIETDETGIPRKPRALHALPKINVLDDGTPEILGDGSGENQEQARELWKLGHESKAQRLACCNRYGRRVECSGGHAYYERFSCGLRFCRNCARRVCADLIQKYKALADGIVKQHNLQVTRIDLTVRNNGEAPGADAIQVFNGTVRSLFRNLLPDRRRFGFLWIVEFGRNNTNLHCHGLYYGPKLDKRKLRREWQLITSGSDVVAMRAADWNFPKVLGQLLSYALKASDQSSQQLAHLEHAFSRVRRVHTLGLFYNSPLLKGKRTVSEECSKCPKCEGRLSPVGKYCSIVEFIRDEIPDLAEVRREMAKQRVSREANSS